MKYLKTYEDLKTKYIVFDNDIVIDKSEEDQGGIIALYDEWIVKKNTPYEIISIFQNGNIFVSIGDELDHNLIVTGNKSFKIISKEEKQIYDTSKNYNL